MKGLVQGVGFRPFIYRLAAKNNLKGRVDNRPSGVAIEIEGEEGSLLKFCEELPANAPAASQIKSVVINPADIKGFRDFRIAASIDNEPETTEISPDIAVCTDCLEDMQGDPRRINYPFTNCTACGPRFTIVEELPYDRVKTSMKEFAFCHDCEREYGDISDRRFHAQPVACNNCGPVYRLNDGNQYLENISEILDVICKKLMNGGAVAIKGMGGYHLACNALDNDAVVSLREKKQRDSKPFAVMFRDILTVNEYCHVSPEEFREMTSWRRPVVILKEKKKLADAVSNGLGTCGAFLPYMPLHYLLFSSLRIPALVMTSGNVSDEPLIKDDREASEKLLPVTGMLVSNNRKIVNRTDDSVIRIIDKKISMIRRARGYVPSPVEMGFSVSGILATGPEQKNSFCIGKDRQAIMSQYIGDLKNLPTYEFFCEAIERFRLMYRFEPAIVACDLHPDYLSTLHAGKLGDELRIKVIPVQHHHAHIASVMAENMLDEKVIGVCLDGTGYGTDGNIWGGEFMVADLSDFTRFAHFDYLPVPGGDKAVDEPWRMGYSYLYNYFGESSRFSSLPFLKASDPSKLEMIKKLVDGNINSPLSSGAGRLFDAVAAITGLCSISGFDSEAPVRLESVINEPTDEFYPVETGKKVIFKETISRIIDDIGKKDISFISAKFHNTVSLAIVGECLMIRKETLLSKVILSGGVFQNAYLSARTCRLLRENGFEVFMNHQVPSNDGGVSLGQLAVAAKKTALCA